MQNFRTVVNIKNYDFRDKINYETSTMLIGSCFTENIGNIMCQQRFPVNINPFGILYNPISVKNSLEMLINKKKFSQSDIAFFNKQWFSFSHHSRFSNPDPIACLDKINIQIKKSSEFLKKANFLVLTFGTARVYELKLSGKVVSNCHKIPAEQFKHYLLEDDEIVEQYKILIKKLLSFNPNLKFIFTVSPIRHWKDGAFENQLSKATLLLAIHKLQKEFYPLIRLNYFPSYEIILDDLRDYRFFEEDMLHPNKTAIKYVWEKFSDTLMDTETKRITAEIEKIERAKNHRPFNTESESHQLFLKNTANKVVELHKKYPFLELKEDYDFFRKKIRS